METSTSTDRIEQSTMIRAPRARVWKALSDSAEFGAWFGCSFDQPFRAGEWVRGQMTVGGYEGFPIEVRVEAIEPERHFAYRWHPAAIEPEVDYSSEPTTLVEFFLEEAPGGTRLTVVETGFDALPAGRRSTAFRMNTQGWQIQATRIAAYAER
jgi:uncharacterized protein YndB with AHSA1/START domain